MVNSNFIKALKHLLSNKRDFDLNFDSGILRLSQCCSNSGQPIRGSVMWKTGDLESISNWREFRREWDKASSRAGKIGLLYVPPTFRPPTNKKRANAAALASFFLGCMESEDEIFSSKAQQVFVSQVLRHHCALDPNEPLLLPWHVKILQFLQKVRQPIARAPYPHTIVNYLLGLRGVWENASQVPAVNPVAHEGLQASTELLVRAFLVWGFADYLHPKHKVEEVCSIIKQFLTESGHKETLPLLWLNHSVIGEEPERRSLDYGNAEIISQARAVITLMQLRRQTSENLISSL